MRVGALAPAATAAFVVLALALVSVVLQATLAARPDPSRLRFGGRDVFLAGVNYPWKTGPGQDFGTGAWGHSGVSDPTTFAEVDADFANMAAHGVRVAKWRVFGDGRYSPEFDEDGSPTGLDDLFFPDIDAALEIARRHDVYLALVLFDSGFWTAACGSGGVHLGGHADVVRDGAKRSALVERVLRPFLRHVADSDRIVAYEGIAEPDWGVRELNTQDDGRHKESLEAVRAFAGAIVDAVHAESRSPVTLEANRSRNMAAWSGLGLDYYSFSWYDWLEEYDPLDTDAGRFGLDRPVVLGEFPVTSAKRGLADVLDIAFDRHYAGAFAWSFAGVDRSGALPDRRAAYTDWVRRHWSAVSLFAAEAPTAGSPLTPPPYALRHVRIGHDALAGVAVETDLFLRAGEPATARVYATPIGSTEPVAEVAAVAAPDPSGVAAVRFAVSSLAEGRPYKLSLGLFQREGRLLKWFDGIAYVEPIGGEVRTPELAALALEDPCHAAR